MAKYIDTLKVYKSHLTAGYSDTQAMAAVESLDDALTDLVTTEDLNIALQLLEQHLKIFFTYMLGGTVLVAVILPIFLKYIKVL